MRQTLCVLVPAKQLEVSNVILLNQIEKVTMAGQFIVDLTSNATTTPPHCPSVLVDLSALREGGRSEGIEPEPASHGIIIRVLME